MTKMNAAVMYGPNDIRYEEVEKPLCPEGGFILKVKAVGLCGSDIRNLTTDSKNGAYPYIYGHEIVGEVIETDTDEPLYQVGKMLYVYPVAHCLKCEECRSGHHECCENAEQYTARPGGFADYIAYTKNRVERGAVFELPKDIDLSAATLAEPLSSTYACVENINVQLGDNVVIFGAGPIGIFLTILCKMRGAKKVIMIEINDERLESAKQFGVDVTINSTREDFIRIVHDATNGKGADKVISANASTIAQVQAIDVARKHGVIVFFGGVPKGKLTEIDTNRIHYNNLWIYGHYGANSSQVEKAFELSVSGKFPADRIITHTLPLSKIKEALELTKTGKALKVVLLPEEE